MNRYWIFSLIVAFAAGGCSSWYMVEWNLPVTRMMQLTAGLALACALSSIILAIRAAAIDVIDEWNKTPGE